MENNTKKTVLEEEKNFANCEEEKILATARKILEKNLRAFEDLGK